MANYIRQNNTFSHRPKDDPRDRIEVEIGDSKQPDFKPQVKLIRWDNEVNFSIRAEEDPTATVETVGDKIVYKAANFEVHQYDKPDAGEDGGHEFEWLLPEKPASNVLTATIQTKGLDFFYQPALTPEEIEQGAERPENVVGSYAVYHKTRSGNNLNGKDYKTGKAFHIYRPKAIDADGIERWCDLHIDEQAGILTVTVPQDFVDSAKYPILVDPTFGYTTVGTSSHSLGFRGGTGVNDFRNAGSKFTATESFTISSISTYVFSSDGTPGLKAGLFDNDGSVDLLESSVSSAVGTPPAWETRSVTGSERPAADYWLVGVVNSAEVTAGAFKATNIRYDTGSTGQGWNKTAVGSYILQTPRSAGTTDDRKYSIYATYTASGPVALEANVFDAITIVDDVSHYEDTVVITESLQTEVLSTASVFDAVGIAESVTTAVVSSVSTFDSVTITEDVSASVSTAVSTFDAVGIAESAAQSLSISVSVSESVGLTETQGPAQRFDVGHGYEEEFTHFGPKLLS